MELNDIRIFTELYHNKSVSKTAEKLNYTQSNISMRLMKLEKEFDSIFFTRSKSGLEILPAAERFMGYITQINQILDGLYEEFRVTTKEINVAATQLLSRLYFPSLYQTNHLFHLYTSPVNKLARGLESKLYDIIITHTRTDFDKESFCYSESVPLNWTTRSVKAEDNPCDSPSIIVNRDKSCPLRNASFQVLASAKRTLPIIEVDTLDLMLSLLHSVPSIALLPSVITDTEAGLIRYPDFAPEAMTVYFYCKNKDTHQLIKSILSTEAAK